MMKKTMRKIVSIMLSIIMISYVCVNPVNANEVSGEEIYSYILNNGDIATVVNYKSSGKVISKVYINTVLKQKTTMDMNTMSMQTEIFDLPSSEVNQEGVESSFNGVRNITTHKVISNETVQNDGKILRAASIYSEPVDNTGLSVYADGYYSLGGWGYNNYTSAYANLYRSYTTTANGETRYWQWGAGETVSAISAYVSALGGPAAAVISVLVFTASSVLAYAQAVRLETLTFNYSYRVRVNGTIYFTTYRNITYWKINNSTTGNSRYEQKSFNAGFSSNNAEMCRMGIDAYYASK